MNPPAPPNPIAAAFAQSFLSVPLERQIAHCAQYDLVPCFRRWLPAHQPILEAGSGSGRWVAWFRREGWQAVGVDWSAELCDRAQAAIPQARFVACDMRHMPFDDGAFGAIVSLGAVEHDADGPQAALTEYVRVLRPGGVAIITVPYLGPLRRLSRALKALRRLGRPAATRAASAAAVRPAWAADYMDDGGGETFFQYNFSGAQMRPLLAAAGLRVVEEFAAFVDEGILHNCGRIAGTYDFEQGCVRFSPLGRLLRRALPPRIAGHMLCFVVTRAAP